MSLKEKTTRQAIGIHYKDGAHKNLIVKGQGPFTLHFSVFAIFIGILVVSEIMIEALEMHCLNQLQIGM